MLLLLLSCNIYCILTRCQALGKDFLYTISFSPYSNPRAELLIALLIRGSCKALEFSQGGTGRREQDWDLNLELQLSNPDS